MTRDAWTLGERQQAAMLLQAKVERYDWALLLDEDGSLLVKVGDDLPGVPQQVVLAALFAFSHEYEAALASRTH